MKRSNKPGMITKVIRGFIIVAALVCLWLGYAWIQISSMGPVKAHKQIDAGIVLGAALWGDLPSPGLRERLDQGLTEFRAGHFRYFILTGGLDTSKSRLTEAQGMANYLIKQGVPRKAILLENKATSTYENLLFSKDIMKDRQLRTAVIITHTYHGRRAKEIADSLNYIDPQLSLVESKVLPKVPNHIREILAYTKWTLNRLGVPLD